MSNIKNCLEPRQSDHMQRIDEIKIMINNRLSDFSHNGVQNPVLDKFINSANKILLSENSKRLRCILPVLVADQCDLSTDECLAYGIIVELLHYTSLIHDDVIDEDQFRRNCKTLNNTFPNSQAVLIGDYIVCVAIDYCLTFTHNKQVIGLVIKAIKNLVTGIIIEQQILPKEPTVECYKEMAANKTGSLFALSFGLPFVGNNRLEEALKCGEIFGVLFQIYDDYLDRRDDDPKLNVFGTFSQSEIISFWNQQLELFQEHGRKLGLEPMINLFFQYLQNLGYFKEISTSDGVLFRNA